MTIAAWVNNNPKVPSGPDRESIRQTIEGYYYDEVAGPPGRSRRPRPPFAIGTLSRRQLDRLVRLELDKLEPPRAR